MTKVLTSSSCTQSQGQAPHGKNMFYHTEIYRVAQTFNWITAGSNNESSEINSLLYATPRRGTKTHSKINSLFLRKLRPQASCFLGVFWQHWEISQDSILGCIQAVSNKKVLKTRWDMRAGSKNRNWAGCGTHIPPARQTRWVNVGQQHHASCLHFPAHTRDCESWGHGSVESACLPTCASFSSAQICSISGGGVRTDFPFPSTVLEETNQKFPCISNCWTHVGIPDIWEGMNI